MGLSLAGAVAVAALIVAAPASGERVEFPIDVVQNGDLEGGTPLIEKNIAGDVLSESFDLPSWDETDNQSVGPICSVAACPEPGERGGTRAT